MVRHIPLLEICCRWDGNFYKFQVSEQEDKKLYQSVQSQIHTNHTLLPPIVKIVLPLPAFGLNSYEPHGKDLGLSSFNDQIALWVSLPYSMCPLTPEFLADKVSSSEKATVKYWFWPFTLKTAAPSILFTP